MLPLVRLLMYVEVDKAMLNDFLRHRLLTVALRAGDAPLNGSMVVNVQDDYRLIAVGVLGSLEASAPCATSAVGSRAHLLHGQRCCAQGAVGMASQITLRDTS